MNISKNLPFERSQRRKH